MNIEEMFKGMDTAEMNGKGNYMAEGKYRVKTTALRTKEGFKGKSFILDFEIVTSNNDAHKPGTSGSWVVKLDKPQAFGDIKGLMFAISGVNPKTVRSPKQDPESHAQASELAKVALDPDYLTKKRKEDPKYLEGLEQTFAVGREIDLETVKIKTKANTDFTVHNWTPASEENSAAA